MVFGVGTPFFAILFGNMMDCFQIVDHDAAIREARNYALQFGGIGAAFLISMAVQGWMFSLSGQLLTERIRVLMFSNMLRQEMGWFDQEKNNTGFISIFKVVSLNSRQNEFIVTYT